MAEPVNRYATEMIHVRLPHWLKELVKEQARLNQRPVNSEVLFRLRQAYDYDEDGVNMAAFRQPPKP